MRSLFAEQTATDCQYSLPAGKPIAATRRHLARFFSEIATVPVDIHCNIVVVIFAPDSCSVAGKFALSSCICQVERTFPPGTK